MKTKTTLSTLPIVTIQQTLSPALPKIFGCKEFIDEEMMLIRADRIFKKSGVEQHFVNLSLQNYEKELEGRELKPEAKRQLLSKHAKRSEQALRCMFLKSVIGGSYREMSKNFARCPLFRHFCKLEELEQVRVPGKSILQEYAHWLPEEQMKEVIDELTLALSDEKKAEEIGLVRAIEMEFAYLDTTCLEANIHFPVDWVLLRDAVRTLSKSIATIRRHGLKKRIAEPMSFLRRINALAIAMSSQRRKADSKSKRKEVLRLMKKLVKVVENHARRYRKLLHQEWEKTDLSRKQAEVILRRMNSVLEQLPLAKKQAHERIIGERKVPSNEKILSLYERDPHVIVRGKANAEVEFGNKLFMAENQIGYIIDHELLRDGSPGDAHLLLNHLEHIKKVTGGRLAALGADRQFDTATTREKLLKENIFNGICNRNPKTLADRLKKEPRFRAMLRRRSQTEPRIGILKNVFLDGTPRAKGFEHRSLQVAWAVFSHNIWVVARRALWKEDELAPLAT